MQPGVGSLSFRLVALLLLLAPGLLAIDVFFRYTEQRQRLSRLQRYVYSAIASLGSLAVLYVLTPLYFKPLEKTVNAAIRVFNIATGPEIAELSFAGLAILYLTHIGITALIGLGSAKAYNRRIPPDSRDRREPWEYAFSVSPEEGETVEVVTSDGTVIQGDYNIEGFDTERRELYLDNPYEVEYADDLDDIERKVSLGRAIFLPNDAISRVVFIEPDPQSEYEVDEKTVRELNKAMEELFGKFEQESLDSFENNADKGGDDDVVGFEN